MTGDPLAWAARLRYVLRTLHRPFRSIVFASAIVAAATTVPFASSVTSDIRISPTSLAFGPVSTRPIYVELDWMEDATHSHKPSQAVIDAIVATFAREGFDINIEVSNAIPHQAVVALGSSPSGSASVQALKAEHFDHIAETRYFYSIWAHNYSTGGVTTTSSGYADLPGNTHLVTLGSFSNQVGTFSNQVGTFIHEFGHNIGQLHGGADNGNYKPNYISVMNYHYQLNGLGPSLLALQFANTSSGFNNFGYSHGMLPALNEANLNETLGIGLGRARDWNCDSIISTSVARDIQASNPCSGAGGLSVLTDYDNWGAINSFIRLGPETPLFDNSPSEVCITPEEDLPLRLAIESLRARGLLEEEDQLMAGGGAPQPLGPAGSFFTVFNDGDTVLNVTGIALDSPASWITWEPKTFSVAAGGSQKVQVYIDYAAAPAGQSTRRLLISSNDADESPYPGGVYLTMEGPGAFSKTLPVNGATGQLAGPALSWEPAIGAASYEYCVDTSNNNACNSSWVSTGANTSVTLNGLTAGMRYYWHVRAINAGGATYSNGAATAFWNFTVAPVRAPLVYLDAGDSGDVFAYDPATGNWSRQLSQPGGGFSLQSQGNWLSGWSVHRADFNTDGLTDFFLFNTTTGEWSKMLNAAGGFTTQASGQWWPGWQRFVTDLDGDGVSDLFLYDPATGAWFKSISTPGGFAYTQGGWNPAWELYPMRLNNDALGDFFLINRTTGRWFWALGAAGPGFTYPVTETWFAGWQFYPGDFSGDGLTDLLLHDPVTGTHFVATTTGSGFTYVQGGWSLGWTPHVADFNADGRSDLLLHAAATGKWFQMLSNGAGSFSNAGGQTWSLGWSLHSGDVNGDVRADMVLYDPATGAWYQARNLVNGAFTYNNGTWAPGLTILTGAPVR